MPKSLLTLISGAFLIICAGSPAWAGDLAPLGSVPVPAVHAQRHLPHAG